MMGKVFNPLYIDSEDYRNRRNLGWMQSKEC